MRFASAERNLNLDYVHSFPRRCIFFPEVDLTWIGVPRLVWHAHVGDGALLSDRRAAENSRRLDRLPGARSAGQAGRRRFAFGLVDLRSGVPADVVLEELLERFGDLAALG